MEEVEDTPIFQERVTYLEGQAKMIKAEAKQLIAHTHAFAKAGLDYAEAGKAFAGKAQELGKVMPALQSAAAGLRGLYALVETMSQLQHELTLPLEQLCIEIRHAKQKRQDMDKAGEEFYSSLSKSLLLLSPGPPPFGSLAPSCPHFASYRKLSLGQTYCVAEGGGEVGDFQNRNGGRCQYLRSCSDGSMDLVKEPPRDMEGGESLRLVNSGIVPILLLKDGEPELQPPVIVDCKATFQLYQERIGKRHRGS